MFDSLDLKRKYMFALEAVVREVGERILEYKGPVQDTRHIRGHEESTLDILAYEWMQGALETHLGRFPEEERFVGEYLFELHELKDVASKKSGRRARGVFRIDEIDGTTNAKRRIASVLNYAPISAVSIALSKNAGMGSILLGTVYDMHNRATFSGMKVDEGFMSFCDGKTLDPMDFVDKRGDSCTRIMVVGYSNTERIKKGEIEQALVDADKNRKQFRIYDGCRSSAIDTLNILRNQFDAYIDARALWPGSGAMLRPYDIAGVIPIARGCGLEISDIFGNSIDKYRGRNNPLTIIIARKGLKDKFVEILKPVIAAQKEASPKAALSAKP